MRKRLAAGIVLLLIGLLAGAMSAYVFGRARDSDARLTDNLQAAEAALTEAGPLEHTDPERYQRLLDTAESHTSFAEYDLREYQLQIDGARYFAAGAALSLAGGFGVLVLRRRRMAQHDHTAAAPARAESG